MNRGSGHVRGEKVVDGKQADNVNESGGERQDEGDDSFWLRVQRIAYRRLRQRRHSFPQVTDNERIMEVNAARAWATSPLLRLFLWTSRKFLRQSFNNVFRRKNLPCKPDDQSRWRSRRFGCQESCCHCDRERVPSAPDQARGCVLFSKQQCGPRRRYRRSLPGRR